MVGPSDYGSKPTLLGGLCQCLNQNLASLDKMISDQPLLFFRMEPVTDLLGNQGGVAPGSVVDNEVHLDLVVYGLVHDLNSILDHLPGQNTVLVKEQFNLVKNVPIPPFIQKLSLKKRPGSLI